MKGFTLIELIVTIFIAGVISGISVYGWQHFIIRTQETSIVQRIVSEMYYARSEAIKRNVSVILCPSTDRYHCGGQWNDSHIIVVSNTASFQSHNTSDISSQGNKASVLRSYSAIPKGLSLRLQSFSNNQMIKFTPYGLLNVQNGTFIVCSRNRNLQFAKAIIVNKLGRIRLSQDADKDGIDEDAEGKPIVC